MRAGASEASRRAAAARLAAPAGAPAPDSLMVGCSPALSASCCFSSLEKNFCAWLRICTAVLVLTWPAAERWGGGASVGEFRDGCKVVCPFPAAKRAEQSSQEPCQAAGAGWRARCGWQRWPVARARRARASRHTGRPPPHAPSILRHCRPCRRSASTKRACSSSVHRSRCLVIVYGLRVCSRRETREGARARAAVSGPRSKQRRLKGAGFARPGAVCTPLEFQGVLRQPGQAAELGWAAWGGVPGAQGAGGLQSRPSRDDAPPRLKQAVSCRAALCPGCKRCPGTPPAVCGGEGGAAQQRLPFAAAVATSWPPAPPPCPLPRCRPQKSAGTGWHPALRGLGRRLGLSASAGRGGHWGARVAAPPLARVLVGRVTVRG